MICSACSEESPDGARFCMHCGAAAADSGPRSGPEQAYPRQGYTPPHLASRILTSRSALEGEHKQVTVLFADVMKSMDLAAHAGADEWHGIMSRFFEIMAAGVHRYEGTVNQYTGDGIMALFGAPIAHEDHAQRACWAALRLQEDLRGYADELRRTRGLSFSVRMGLNSGEVVVGKIGDDLRMDYTAQGHMVGLAQRVEQVAAPDRIYLARETSERVRGYFDLRELGAFDLRGAPEPLVLCELVRAGAIRSRLELARARGFTRFVGRASEMQELDDALARALEGRAQLLCFVGEAGVGKSRLCHEFLDRCRADGIPCTDTQGVSHGRNVPLLPILELYRRALGVNEHESPQEARERIAGRVLLLDPSLMESLPLVFDFLGVPDPERPAPALSPEARQRRLVEFDVRYSIARSQREPMVALYEDLHWFDGASLEWLQTLIESAAETRTLVVVNFRPEFQYARAARFFRPALRIAPLADESAAAFLEALVGSSPTLTELGGQILSKTSGNPFFIEEVVRSLVESGHLEGASGEYRLAGGLPAIEIPSRVQAILAARIDQLGDVEKVLLQAAAVVGGSVSRPLLEAIGGLAGEELDAALANLVQREFLFEESLYPEAVYEFVHPLTREVAYRSQLDERRSSTHGAVARAILALEDGRLDERAALLAHHYDEARESFEAARWHYRAAAWIKSQNLDECMRHLRSARWRLVDLERGGAEAAQDSLALEVRVGLLEVGGRQGLAHGEADRFAEEGRALLERVGDDAQLASLLVNYGNCCIFGARFEEGGAAIAEAEKIAEACGRRDLLVLALTTGAFSFMARGSLARALELNGRALSALDTSGGEGEGYRAMLVSSRAGILWLMGLDDEALRCSDGMLALGEDPTHSEWIATHHALYAVVSADRGRADEALRRVARCVEIGERAHNTNVLIHGLLTLAAIQRRRGEWQDAMEACARARKEIKDSGILQAETRLLCQLASSQLGAGDAAEALATAEEAVALSREREQLYGVEAQRVRTAALRSLRGVGAEEEMLDALARAERLMEETGARHYAGPLHRERAELRLLLGDREGARRELELARAVFQERGATVGAGEAEARLAALDG